MIEEGENAGEKVEQYLSSTKLGPGFPWCAAFVHWCHRECSIIPEPAREFAAAARWAREHEVFRKGQLDMYWDGATGHELQRISEDGDVGTLFYANLGRVGHCFIIIDENDDYVFTIEGNTGSGGEREGQGVYKRKRSKNALWTVNRWSGE